MTGKLVDRLVAAGVFLVALVVYVLTMAETLPFWDSGEFIASVRFLEVMHPPGAPFYILLGRFLTMLAPLFAPFTDEPVAMAVNFISALSSAGTALLTHLVVVRLVRVWKGRPETWGPGDRLAALVGGAVGGLAFAFSDSFWFNAVEAEVYALSMFFTAAAVWLTLVWREATLEEEAEVRAQGAHPFGLHADRYLLLIAYLFGLAIGVHLLNVLTLFFVALIVFFTKFERPEWTMGRRLVGIGVTGVAAALVFFAIYPGIIQKLPSLAGATGVPGLFTLLVLGALVAAVVVTQRRRRPVLNLVALAVAMIVVGYSTYGVIFLRSAADPPIDLNDPETAGRFVSYLEREQYGQTPLLSGHTYDDQTGSVGYTVRAGRVVEAAETSLPRRWSPDPGHVAVYQQYDSDGDFFWRWQIGHMYVRYFLWNFVGRAGDFQDAPWISGLAPGETDEAAYRSPSERMARNAYFGLPLLLGLVGLTFHFVRDWRRALAVLALFLVTGVGIVLYLNQTPNQPRERDYSYVASFFAFSLWIGIGATGLVELATEAVKGSARRVVGWAVAFALILAVPGLMLAQNYDDHDRSGNRLATDFAWNMLQSTAPNAILFTNGDNDTYPLWYLQEVEGVRPDVRVVNLSLLQTDWYVKQLKNEWARESAPLPMSFTDEQAGRLQAVLDYTPREFALAAPPGGRPVTWLLHGRQHPYEENLGMLYPNDLAVLDILAENARRGWERPIYFAATIAEDSELGLQPYFQNEGLARRVTPFRSAAPSPDGRVDPAVAVARLSEFRYRNLDDPGVYYDENARNLADTFRRITGPLAAGLAERGRPAEAREVLARVSSELSPEVIPPSFYSLVTLAQAYEALGDQAGLTATLRPAEDLALTQLQRARTAQEHEQALQYVQFVQGAYLQSEAYEEASAFYGRLAETTGDDALRLSPGDLRREAEAARPAPPAGG